MFTVIVKHTYGFQPISVRTNLYCSPTQLRYNKNNPNIDTHCSRGETLKDILIGDVRCAEEGGVVRNTDGAAEAELLVLARQD